MIFKKILNPLSVNDFRWLFMSQLTNNLGMFLDYVALMALLVYVWRQGPRELAVFSIVYGLPMVISPFAGALVDRWPLRKVMVVSSLIATILTFLLMLVKSVEMLILVIFFRATAKIFYFPAEISVIKFMFKKDELMAVNSLVQGLMQAFRIVGPIVGGGLLIFLRPEGVFLITTFLYLGSTVFLFLVPKKYDYVCSSNKKYNVAVIVNDIFEMLKVFSFNYKLLFSFISLTLATFTFFLSESMITIFAKSLGFTGTSFEWIFVLIGMGGIIGSLSLSRKKKEEKILPLIFYGIGSMGLLIFISAVLCPLLGEGGRMLFLGLWLFIGIGISYVSIPYTVLIMSEIPATMIGKASSMSTLACGTSLLVAPIIGAMIAKWFNISVSFLLTGVLLMLAFVGLAYSYHARYRKTGT